MPFASNYTTALNRQAKRHTERWIVTAIYADTKLNTEYAYRTQAGATNQVAHLQRLIQSDASRNLGCEIPLVATDIRMV
jgi:hypothetical protein